MMGSILIVKGQEDKRHIITAYIEEERVNHPPWKIGKNVGDNRGSIHEGKGLELIRRTNVFLERRAATVCQL